MADNIKGFNELNKFIAQGKRSLVYIASWIEHYKINIPVMLDLEQSIDMLKYMSGYFDCLERISTLPITM